jgi:hypothetical protein
MILTTLALTSAAVFAGAAIYVSLVEHPARLMLDDVALLKEWKPSYAKGKMMQAALALLAGGLGLAAFYVEHRLAAAIGAVLILANWPFTLWVIAPTNNALNATVEPDAGAASRTLLLKWGRLHAVRTWLGIASTCAFLVASAGP